MRTKVKSNIPSYRIGDLIKKPNSPKKWVLISDSDIGYDGVKFTIMRRKTSMVGDHRVTPLELFVYGYQIIGHVSEDDLYGMKVEAGLIRTRWENSRRKKRNEDSTVLKRAAQINAGEKESVEKPKSRRTKFKVSRRTK